MVNSTRRVAPVQTIIVQPISSPPPPNNRTESRRDSGNLSRRQVQWLIFLAAACALVVAAAVGTVVVVWSMLGSVLWWPKNNNNSNSTSIGASWNGTNDGQSTRSIRPLPNPTLQSFVLNHTAVSDYLQLTVIRNNSNEPSAAALLAATTKRLSADSKLNFPPCARDDQIQCSSDGKCIPRSKRCNKVKDCIDSSDEFNCSCIDYLRSTSPGKMCDGYPDCPGQEDESGCAYQCQNQSKSSGVLYFRCSMSDQCIPMWQVCDGKHDCRDGQDELECWMLAPNVDATAASSQNYRTYYDFGYVFRRHNGVWYPLVVTTTNDNAQLLGRMICEKVHYRSLLYSVLRPISDTRLNGCFMDTGRLEKSNSLEGSLQLRPSCPSKMALYIACDELICGHLPDCRPARKRVVGGTNTGAFCNPWMVALYRDGEMACQAVVLNNLWMITAAHCFKEEQRRWTARLGMYRQSSWSPYTVARNVVSVIRHPNFTDDTVETNDVALIRLDRPVSFSAALQPPCLPTGPSDSPSDGEMCTVFGWGYMVEDGLQFADELRQVDLTVISNQRCNACPSFFRSHITEGHLCLSHGSEKKDACQGDSGGPLLCARTFSDRSRYLAGVTSTGDGCARADVPGVWTRLSVYIDWINSTLSASSTIDELSAISAPVGSERRCSGFQCASGECVYSYFRCDGGWDCQVDGADEIHCPWNNFIMDNTKNKESTTGEVLDADVANDQGGQQEPSSAAGGAN